MIRNVRSSASTSWRRRPDLLEVVVAGTIEAGVRERRFGGAGLAGDVAQPEDALAGEMADRCPERPAPGLRHERELLLGEIRDALREPLVEVRPRAVGRTNPGAAHASAPSRSRSNALPRSRSRSCFASSRLRRRIDGRRDLDQLVLGDELERRLEGERPWRRQAQRLVVGMGPDVGELLLLRRVHVHVAGAAVLAHDHALVDLDAGADEQLGALLEVEQAVGIRGARFDR